MKNIIDQVAVDFLRNPNCKCMSGRIHRSVCSYYTNTNLIGIGMVTSLPKKRCSLVKEKEERVGTPDLLSSISKFSLDYNFSTVFISVLVL